MPRTADFIEEQKSLSPPPKRNHRGPDKRKRKTRKYMPPPESLAALEPFKWPKGVSGNPGGQPGVDVAALIARRVLEDHSTAIYEGLAAQAAKGNAYTFKELAERGYGRLSEKHEHTHQINLTLTDVRQRIAELLDRSGRKGAIEASGVGAEADAGKQD